MPASRSNLIGALLSLTAFASFATHDAIVKVLGGAYSPIQIVFFSTLFGVPLVALLLMNDPTAGTLRPKHPWWLLARTAAVVVTGLSAFYAFATLPLAEVYAILFAAPLLITVLSIPILGETVRLRRWLAVLVGLVGVLVVLRPGAAAFGLGHAAALTAAIGGSLASIIVRKIGREERTAVLLLYPMMANLAVMGALLPLVYQPMPLAHLGLLATMALLATAAGMIIIAAYRHGEPVVVAPMQYSQILWASVFGALLFDEVLTLSTAIGSSVVIASGLYILFRESGSGASRTTPVLRSRGRPDTGTHPRVDPLLARSPGHARPLAKAAEGL